MGFPEAALRRAFPGIAAVCLLAFCAAAQGQAPSGAAGAWPSRPIRIQIAFAAGGLADMLARTVTDRVTQTLGQPFILENKPGAGGNVAMESVARSAPDGYTLLMIGPGLTINGTLYKKLNFDPLKDLVAVSAIAIGPYAVYVSSSIPVNNIAEFISYAKARPGQLNYASVGIGSGGHLSGVLLALAAGIDMTHVPYKGIQGIAPDMVSGQVHLVFNAFGPLNGFVQSGKVKLIGVSSAKRVAAYPDVPSLAESGLPGFDAGGWYAFFLPAATPRDIVVRLNAEVVKAFGQRDVYDRIDKTGLQPSPQSLDEAAQFVRREAEKWGKAVRASGAVAE
ncbi:MAG: tripartite tricarboxylate transporter substrate binding protein [Betaproteobacteria bacterium]|nr:tripartite tricarboxylate transporter substrate binding protein [Betaproteobacteria bacterium]